MKNTQVLVLTDHKTHGKGESIYSLLQTMLSLNYDSNIYVATRSFEKNKTFFANFQSFNIYAKEIDNTFKYSENGDWYKEMKEYNVNNFDVIFLRLDRPLNNNQLKNIDKTYDKPLIINNPLGIINTSSKEFLLRFPQYSQNMTICNDINAVYLELNKFPIVLKPLEGYGGLGLIKIDKKEIWHEDKKLNFQEGISFIKEYLKNNDSLLSMKYLKNVSNGDKRIIVVNGKILGATLRLPAEKTWLCNLKQGGRSVFSDIEKEEYEIVRNIDPILNKEGILIYGIDTLEDDNGKRVLSEINTLNVGGFLQVQENTDRKIIKEASALIWKFISEKLT